MDDVSGGKGGSGNEALEDLALMIDGSPEVAQFATDLHVNFVEVPAPLAEATHAADPLPQRNGLAGLALDLRLIQAG